MAVCPEKNGLGRRLQAIHAKTVWSDGLSLSASVDALDCARSIDGWRGSSGPHIFVGLVKIQGVKTVSAEASLVVSACRLNRLDVAGSSYG